MGNSLSYLSCVDFSGCVRVAHPVLFFQNCALIRAQRSSRFRVVAQQLFRTGPPLRQGDGYFVRCQVAQHQQLSSVRRTIAAVPIHGVPVVKPAFALASHCIGVRPLSRLR